MDWGVQKEGWLQIVYSVKLPEMAAVAMGSRLSPDREDPQESAPFLKSFT